MDTFPKTTPQRYFFSFAVAIVIVAGALIPVKTQGQSEGAAAIAAFELWTRRYVAPLAPALKAQMESEGLNLAKQRRAALAQLIGTNPEKALAVSVPASIRAQLPAEIAEQLEAPVSGIGDYAVLGAIAARGGPPVEPNERFVHMNNQTYRAYVYGRRAGQTTKNGIPLYGVAMDGMLALHEDVLVELKSGEAPDANKPLVELRNATEQQLNYAVNSILAEMGGKVYRLASREHLQRAEALLEAAEAGMGPDPIRPAAAVLAPGTDAGKEAGPAVPQPNSAQSEGLKRVLVIRVDFSDLPGDPKYSYGGGGTPIYTAAYVQNFIDAQISPFYSQSSYGNTSLSNTVSAELYRMPQTAVYYATNGGNNQLHVDARTAASANYALAGYDRIIVLFSGLGSFSGSKIKYGGLANVGGPNIWINGEFDFRVVAHELGHTYGLSHANLWQVNDGNPISAGGTNVEYADDFDTMGENQANDTRTDFNPWFKNRLNWIHNAQVLTVTSNGIYRVNRFDAATATGILALKVVQDATHNYWIGCRRKFTNNSSMQNGAYVIWGFNSNRQSDLLDMTTPGSNDKDAALAIGAAFFDPGAGLTIRPVAKGGTAPNEYVDVQIIFGPIPRLTGLTLKQNVFSFQLNGPIGSNYFVQAASDLANWSSFSTNTIPPSGFALITDPVPGNQPRRFYRAVPAGP